jgi:hypothetical protein
MAESLNNEITLLAMIFNLLYLLIKIFILLLKNYEMRIDL